MSNFHQLSLALSAYYITLMHANTIIVFSNYCTLASMAESFKVESFVQGYNIYKGVLSAAVGTTLHTLSTRKVPSLRG